MKKKLLFLGLMLYALCVSSQDYSKYYAQLECIYEVEFDTVIYVGGLEQTITIYSDSVVTVSGTDVFVDSIVDINKWSEDYGVTYTLRDQDGYLIWLIVLDNYIRYKSELDPKMHYYYQIIRYEKVY